MTSSFVEMPPETAKFVMVFLFEDPREPAQMQGLLPAMLHIPKFWSVSDAQRAFVASLAENSSISPSGAWVVLSKEVSGTRAELDELSTVLEEIASTKSGKKFLFEDASIAPLFCIASEGGRSEKVAAVLEGWEREDQAQSEEQTAQSSIPCER